MTKPLFYALVLLCSIGAFSLELQAQSSRGENDFRVLTLPEQSDTLRVSEIRMYDDVDIALNPFKLLNINEEFIIAQDQIPESFFTTISWETLDVLYKWGRESRGPEAEEFPNYPYFNFPASDNGKPHFQTYDAITGALRTLEITEESPFIVSRNELRMEPWYGPHNTMTRLHDELYAFIHEEHIPKSDGQQADHEWIAIRPDSSKSLLTFGSYPLKSVDRSEMNLASYFHKFGISNQRGDRFASFYYFFDAFKIFDDEGTELYARYIDSKNVGSPEAFFADRPEDQAGSLPPRWADDDYIFTQRNVYENEELSQVYLEVWNWQAELLYTAPLDHAISTFTVSREHNKIAGVRPERENAMFIWDLGEVMKQIEVE